jgi:CheY-like chemotaxis protein
MAKKILVVDDDKLILMTLKRLLTQEGYKVITAPSGQWALKRMEENGFDLIISDIKMPEMDGVETVRKIRELLVQKGKDLIPEIFITAYAKEDIFQKALDLKAAGYIEKPFDIKGLLQTIKKVTEEWFSSNSN